MIVPNDGPSTVWIQQLDDNGQPIPGQRVRTTARTVSLTPFAAWDVAECYATALSQVFRSITVAFELAAPALRELCNALGITPYRTPLERHLSARMSRVRRARQRR